MLLNEILPAKMVVAVDFFVIETWRAFWLWKPGAFFVADAGQCFLVAAEAGHIYVFAMEAGHVYFLLWRASAERVTRTLHARTQFSNENTTNPHTGA